MNDKKLQKFHLRVYFSDHFNVTQELIKEYGAFNISLVSDLPLFIDPFLLFNSYNPKYQELHQEIIKYLKFIREKSRKGTIHAGLLKSWFQFPEVSQTWLGYSGIGNSGRGLGRDFAHSLFSSLNNIFTNFGTETVTKESHLEKLCLIKDGVGRDNISDFTTNLIKGYLLEYTQTFAINYIDSKHTKLFQVDRVKFNYNTQTWERGKFILPLYQNNYILLTPRDILTRDETWINKFDLREPHTFHEIAFSISNEQLRAEISNYFHSILLSYEQQTKKEIQKAITKTINKYPQIIDYYIRYKEDNEDQARIISSEKVTSATQLFIHQAEDFITKLNHDTDFYSYSPDTYTEAHERVNYLKDVIENKGGHRFFFIDNRPIRREDDLQILFRLVWFASLSDVSREVNDGRGPVDFKISRGSRDKTLVEFKLATNSQLKRNLQNQTKIYEKASDTNKTIKVIMYFTKSHHEKVKRILEELDILNDPDVVLIDARNDNKPSGSKA